MKKAQTKPYRPKHLPWALLAAIVGLGWFYWYQWRPSQIRKTCTEEAASITEIAFKYYRDKVRSGEVANKAIQMRDEKYKFCLNQHGIRN